MLADNSVLLSCHQGNFFHMPAVSQIELVANYKPVLATHRFLVHIFFYLSYRSL